MNIPLFIDSGAHGLYSEHVLKKQHKEGYTWYESDEFWLYVDQYITFISMHPEIEYYANVDVIFNPVLTWKVQKYMERKGLRPIPVIHASTSLHWLQRYMKSGYEYIALGGLGQEITKSSYFGWADDAFDLLCDQPSRLPKCKVHGFAMTAHSLIVRYPWYSVDSTSWIQYAAYGNIIMPIYKEGWRYDVPYYIVRVSDQEMKNGTKLSAHKTYKTAEKKLLLRYIEEKGFVLGKSEWDDKKEIVVEPGLCNDSAQRCALNALYFADLVQNLPEWPWAFNRRNPIMQR